MAGFLKPIPQRSEYPFDPDNPVPNGVQLTPAELRAKYYKVIDSNARYYTGDPRLLRDRDSEVDPALTKHFRQYRADGMEVVDSTNRNLIDEICRGRWCILPLSPRALCFLCHEQPMQQIRLRQPIR